MDRNSFLDEIPQDMFTNIQEIGSGTFADIFSAVYLNTNSKVALKVSLKGKNDEELKSFKQEVLINKSLHHPFVCKYFTDIETEHLKIIVMELIEGISALDYVNKFRGLPFQDALNLFTELVIAIEYLHNDAHIAHRDLKLENIMIDKYNHIHLIDFGLSSAKQLMSTCCGSIPYCAPELFSGQKYTKAADIWSLGVILYALIDGNLPFYHNNINVLASIICQKEVKFSSNFQNSQIQDLLKKMLKKDPQQRITIDEIKKHPSLSQQKLLQINYKQLFESHQVKAINSSSQMNGNKSLLSQSSICIKFSTGSQHYPLLKEISSSRAPNTQNNMKINNFSDRCNKLDECIKERIDLAINLDKLIENAINNAFPQRNIILSTTLSNSFGSRIGCHRFKCKRNNPYRPKNGIPILQPNINNNQNHI